MRVRVERDVGDGQPVGREPVATVEALLQQVRAATMPFVNATVINSTLDAARGFSGNVVQPQNQWTLTATAGMPVLAAARWAARAQQADRVEIERLNTADVRRQIAVSAATAYLAVINQKRLVEVQAPPGATSRHVYVTPEWAHRWPSEEIWVARKRA